MNGFVVVDASVAVKWLIEEADSEKAHAILNYWEDEGIVRIAPYLMPFEVANVLHRRVVSGDLRVSESGRMMQVLLGSGLELRQTRNLHRRALELASLLSLGAAYDAHYLALAEELDCYFWTADERFYRVAARMMENIRWIGEFVLPG